MTLEEETEMIIISNIHIRLQTPKSQTMRHLEDQHPEVWKIVAINTKVFSINIDNQMFLIDRLLNIICEAKYEKIYISICQNKIIYFYNDYLSLIINETK